MFKKRVWAFVFLFGLMLDNTLLVAQKQAITNEGNVISLYNSHYKYPRTLSSTLVETSHLQQYFGSHLPNLNDKNKSADEEFVAHFLDNLLFKVLD